MRESDWNKIKDCWELLLNDLQPKELVSKLYEIRILSEDNKERILKPDQTRRDQVETLLDVLRTAEHEELDVYSEFYTALGTIQGHLANTLKPPGKLRRKVGHDVSDGNCNVVENRRYIEHLGDDELSMFLDPIFRKLSINDPVEVLKAFKSEKVDGRVFLNITAAELSDICPALKFGERKKIILERDQYIENEQQYHSVHDEEITVGGIQEREYPRKFNHKVQITEKYQRGKNLQTPAARTNDLMSPVHLCIPISNANTDVNSAVSAISWETVKFAAACINDRTNGTIHFGIHDGEDGKHMHGEVEGIMGLERRDCEEAIATAVKDCFSPEQYDAVKSCISNSNFIDVTENHNSYGFVLEIDIMPTSSFVKDGIFFVTDQFTRKGQKKSDKHLFRLEAGKPKQQTLDSVQNFIKSVEAVNNQRLQAERTSVKSIESKPLLRKLQEFFCDGDTKLGDVYPVLVINATDTDMTAQDIHSNFAFLANIDWVCIFDFDASGATSGIFKYLQEKHHKEYKIKLTGDFDQREDHPQKQVVGEDKLREAMTSSHLVPWIFCNGYTQIDQQELDVMKWKTERSEGFKEAVRYFSHEIPRDRAKVVFLLLSKNYKVMLEAAEELCLKFQHQWIVMSPTDSTAAQWQDQMICREYVTKETIERRMLIGYSWEELGVCMKEITDDIDENNGECSLFHHLRNDIKLPKNEQNKLCDLDVLSISECQRLEELSSEQREEIAMRNETSFYQGHQPTWINFYRGTHVLKRRNHEQLLQSVDKVLKGNIPDNTNIGRVTIYHQPGSGGTTTAKHVLWDLRHQYRCCVLKSYSKESHNQIVQLWKYNEDPCQARPILVLVDNLEEDKLQSLGESLKDEADKYMDGGSKVMCVLLLCHRQTSLPPDHEQEMFVLKHDLHPEERAWFQSKYNCLTESFKRQKGPDPKILLSLNIMKENFSEKYIKSTVDEILGAITHVKERTLIKYVSLINAYDQQFRAVPISCFDTLMMRFHVGKKWESMLSTSARLVLMKTKEGIRVVSPLLCKWLLEYLLEKSTQSLGGAVLEFLHSGSCRFRHVDSAGRELLSILSSMMKHRELTASGKPMVFSRLIQELHHVKNVDTAAEILEMMFEKTEDPYIAQQAARLFIYCENWPQASSFADKATRVKPDSSFLWDTHGQIFKLKLAKICENGLKDSESENQKIIQEAVECAYEGTCRFRKVQELASRELLEEPNTAGYFGEIRICVSLLETFCLIPKFIQKSELQKFLSGTLQVCGEMSLLTLVQRQWLHSLEEQVMTTYRKLEEETYRDVTDPIAVSPRRQKTLRFNYLEKLGEELASYFGDDDLPTTEGARKLSPEKRRRQVKRLGVNSFQSILKLSKSDQSNERLRIVFHLTQLNASGENRQHYDLRIAIGSALVLSQFEPDDSPDFGNLLWMSKQLLGTKPGNDYIDLEPFLFHLLLHWPTISRKVYPSLESPDCLLEALSKWNQAYQTKCDEDRKGYRSARSKPFFFLTREAGTQSVIHANWLKKRKGEFHQLGKILSGEDNRRLLQRYKGTLKDGGWKVSLQLETPKGSNIQVDLPLYIRESRESLINKEVQFVIGFGWSGPLACDVVTETELVSNTPQRVTTPQFQPQPQNKTPFRVQAYPPDQT